MVRPSPAAAAPPLCRRLLAEYGGVNPAWDVVTETWLGAPCLSYRPRPASVAHILDDAVRRDPDAPAFVVPPLTGAGGDPETLTAGQFAGLVAGAVESLRALGLQPGDRLGVVAGNGLELAVAQFACATAGFVLVGVNTRAAPTQWAWVLGQSRAALVAVTPAMRPRLEAALAAATPSAGGVLHDAATLLTGRRGAWQPPADIDEAATYAVVYTSGSTGRPKGSQVVHRASVHSAMSYQGVLGLEPGERTAVAFPLYYISAMHAHVLPALLSGAVSVLVPDPSPAAYLRLLAAQQISWAYAVPAVWQQALRLPGFDAASLPQLRRLAAGGAPFPPALVAALRERLPGTRFFDVYGLTETHSPACVLTDTEFATHPGTVGRPLPCLQARTVHPDGRPTAVGEAGELWLRGALVTTGYLDDAGATAATVRDGWLATGDVARLDSDGYLTLLDRVKDMVNRGGTKVFSAEVERVLRGHPQISDAAVVAAPDPVAGEAVYAFLVADSSSPPGVRELRQLVTHALGDFAAPRFVEFLTELPRNPVGKVDKPALRERARQATGPR